MLAHSRAPSHAHQPTRSGETPLPVCGRITVVYSNLIYADAVEPLEEGGRQVGEYRVFSFDPLTEEVLEGQARAHAESCGVLGS